MTFLLISFHAVQATNNGSSKGARSYALGGNSSQLTDLWSVENNPAAIVYLKGWQAGIHYDNSFFLKELSTRGFVLSNSLENGHSWGLNIQQFGFKAYNENKVGFSYGQLLGKNFSLGIQFNYLYISIEEGYGNSNSISGNLGFHSQVSDKLVLAGTIINPTLAGISKKQKEDFPTLVNLGVSYEYSNKLLFLTEISKDLIFEANLKTGIEYHVLDNFFLRVGYATQPASNSFGFGFSNNYLKIDLGSSYHSRLGYSTQLSISYLPLTNKK